MLRKPLSSVLFWILLMTLVWSGVCVYLISDDAELTAGSILGSIVAGFIINAITMPILALIAGYSIAFFWHIKYLIDITVIELRFRKKS